MNTSVLATLEFTWICYIGILLNKGFCSFDTCLVLSFFETVLSNDYSRDSSCDINALVSMLEEACISLAAPRLATAL